MKNTIVIIAFLVAVSETAQTGKDVGEVPVIVNGLPPGSHKMLIELENPNNQLLDEAVVRFVVPEAQ